MRVLLSHVIAPLLGAAVIAGCASYGGAHLVPGQSTAAEVEATMGPPADRVQQADGETVWFYPRGRLGRQTFAVRIGSDNIVGGVEQRLNEDNVKRIVAGKTTIQEVRALMGPPYSTTYFPRKQHGSWEYPMIPGSMSDWMILWVQYSDDGIVREVLYSHDPEKNDLSPEDDRS